MIPELLPEATNAHVLVLSLSESMNAYRQSTRNIEVRSPSPRWFAALNMTLGQVTSIFLLPMEWRHRRDTHRIVNSFRNIDISQYGDDAADKFCELLADSCDFMDKTIREMEELQFHRVWVCRPEYKRRVAAREELEQMLEAWILARSPEFLDLFSSVSEQFRQYIETTPVPGTASG